MIARNGFTRGNITPRFFGISPTGGLAVVVAYCINMATGNFHVTALRQIDPVPAGFNVYIVGIQRGNMGDHTPIGEFEQLVMLAVLQLQEGAYGVPIRREIEKLHPQDFFLKKFILPHWKKISAAAGILAMIIISGVLRYGCQRSLFV